MHVHKQCQMMYKLKNRSYDSGTSFKSCGILIRTFRINEIYFQISKLINLQD